MVVQRKGQMPALKGSVAIGTKFYVCRNATSGISTCASYLLPTRHLNKIAISLRVCKVLYGTLDFGGRGIR